MSMEDYAIHIAPRGGKIDLIVDAVSSERQAAFEQRKAYMRSKGAVGLYQCEANVSGLIFESAEKIPPGWEQVSNTEGGVVASPKAKDRTKAAREQVKVIRAELAALPALIGADAFTRRIGSAWMIVPGGFGGRFRALNCYYERIGDITFVMTPWHHPADATGENVDEKVATEKERVAFMPEGCERVPLSRYYAAKEAIEATAA